MAKMSAPSDPDCWVSALDGWRRPLVERLRGSIATAAPFDQAVKWGNLLFLANGPAILIHVEHERVLLGFWRGKRLRDRAPLLKASGKYELANWTFREGDHIDTRHIADLARAAAALNAELGDPTRLA